MHTLDPEHRAQPSNLPTVSMYYELGTHYKSIDIDTEGVANYLSDRGLSDDEIGDLSIYFSGQDMSAEEMKTYRIHEGFYNLNERQISLCGVTMIQSATIINLSNLTDQERHDPEMVEQTATAIEEETNNRCNVNFVHELEHYVQHCQGQSEEQLAFQEFRVREYRKLHRRVAAVVAGTALAASGVSVAAHELLGVNINNAVPLGLIAGVIGLHQIVKRAPKHFANLREQLYDLDPHEHDAFHAGDHLEHNFITVALSDLRRESMRTVLSGGHIMPAKDDSK